MTTQKSSEHTPPRSPEKSNHDVTAKETPSQLKRSPRGFFNEPSSNKTLQSAIFDHLSKEPSFSIEEFNPPIR